MKTQATDDLAVDGLTMNVVSACLMITEKALEVISHER